MAIECSEKALEVDDLAEECYQHLMVCHHQLGRPAKVLAVYSRYRSVLEARLGIEPSAKTKTLLAILCSGRQGTYKKCLESVPFSFLPQSHKKNLSCVPASVLNEPA